MKIWIINPYGSIPGEDWRTYRTTLIADALVARGHEVVSWISNIQHRSKQKRAEDWKRITVYPGYEIRIVPSSTYQGHISLDRIRYERSFARNMRSKAMSMDENPDVIILGEPALFISDIILPLVRKKRAKLIVDVIDLWPELFHILLPGSVERLGRWLFAPLYYRRKRLFQKSDALMAVCADYLEVAQRANPQIPTALVYLGVDLKEFEETDSVDSETIPVSVDLAVLSTIPPKKEGELWIIYAGTLGEHYDLPNLLRAAQLCQETGLPIRLLIAGEGPLRDRVIADIHSGTLANTYYLGSLPPEELVALYKQCDLAVSSYVRHSTVAMPVKAYDYMAAGLPMINSLGRDLKYLVETREIGLQYRAEDPNDLFGAIQILVEDEALRLRMKKNALDLVKGFDVHIQYPKAVSLVESLSPDFRGLRPLSPKDAPYIASLHIRTFQGFFLTTLGRRFLEKFYQLVLQHPHGLGVGEFREGKLIGFAIGSRRANGFYTAILKSGWWPLFWRAFPALLSRPASLGRIWKSLRSGGAEKDWLDPGVLLSLAVAPDMSRQGVGSGLLQSFESELCQSGVAGLSLTTDQQDNFATNEFYIQNSYIFVKTIMQGNRPMNVYYKSFEV